MVVTMDDKMEIKVFKISKVWDIRKQSCIQSIYLESSRHVNKILDIQVNKKIAFLNNRIVIMEWDSVFKEDK